MKLALNRRGWPSNAFRTAPFAPSLGDVFEGFARALSSEPGTDHTPLNVWETDDKYFVESAVPGFTQDEIEVSVEGRALKIAGKKSEESEDGLSYHRRERSVTTFERSIDLPLLVEVDGVSAQLQQGVLTVELAKAAAALPRRIEVRS